LVAVVTTAATSTIANARLIGVGVGTVRAWEWVRKLAPISVKFPYVGTVFERGAGAGVRVRRIVVVVRWLALEGSSRVELVDSLEVVV
jgi:hypothetical protein